MRRESSILRPRVLPRLVGFLCAVALAAAVLGAQAPSPAQGTAAGDPRDGVTPPADYVIGPGDKLSVRFWDDPKMSAEVVVRPDGMISLPLLNDVSAAGLTPDELRERVTQGALAFVEGPNVQVIVTEILSRQVFITGMVAASAPYPLLGPMRVVQLITMAGGLLDFANEKNILVIREENGQQRSYKFNYKDFRQGKNLQQNILLKPGDTVIVP